MAEPVLPPQTQLIITLDGFQGPPGPPGSGITDPDALHVYNRLNEFADETSKAQARANLGLETIDGGTF